MPTNESLDNVSLRIIALAHQTNENEDIHLILSLDTSIAELKERLQQSLSNRPRPDAQRLIYQGRPLVDSNAVLRNVLRLETSTAANPPAHVIHLVVREDQPIPYPNTNTSPHTGRIPNQGSTPTHHPSSVPSSVHRPGVNAVPQPFAPGLPANPAIQNMMQQHMANVAAMHLHHVHHTLQNGQSIARPPPAFNMPHLAHTQAGQAHAPPGGATMFPNTQSPSPNAVSPNMNAGPEVVQSSFSMRIEEVIGPNGERHSRVTQSGPSIPVQGQPIERSASVPAPGIRTTMPNSQAQPFPPFSLPPPPFHHPHHPLPAGVQQILPTPLTEPVTPGHLGHVSRPAVRSPVVYLVSSPSGPEALLFSPGHGVFSSQQTNVSRPVSRSQTVLTEVPAPVQQGPANQTSQQLQESAQHDDQIQINARPVNPATAPPPAPVPNPANAQVQLQEGRRDGEDLIALVLQRGWLFLRLYMFIFVLSEPNTWRRYILLIIASLVCLLPRSNPFTDLFHTARRHFDNLIGPPQPALRQQRQRDDTQQAVRANIPGETVANTASPSNAHRSRATIGNDMPTPQQHAQRLLREHEERSPNIVRDAIYRLEQGLALFLASLIPGVGERHVRAREEARRLEQQERERRQREDEQRSHPQTERDESEAVDIHNDKKSAPSSSTDVSTQTAASTIATSTAVDSTHTADEGPKMRHAHARE